MFALKPADLENDVRLVLQSARTGKGPQPGWLTAYQILEQLPSTVRDAAIKDRGHPGAGAGKPYTAASLVADTLERLQNAGEIEVTYLECRDVSFLVAGQTVTPGYQLTGLYRLK